jgi:hypothetical protein
MRNKPGGKSPNPQESTIPRSSSKAPTSKPPGGPSIVVSVRYKKHELPAIDSKAERSGINRSAYVRAASLAAGILRFTEDRDPGDEQPEESES